MVAKKTHQCFCAPTARLQAHTGFVVSGDMRPPRVSSAPQSAAMARGTSSRTLLFPHMALIHATEPRVLFGWFSSFLPLCSGTGELSPSQPLPPAVHPRGTPGPAGARPGRSGCPTCRDVPAPSTREGGRAGRGSAVTPRGEGSARRDSDSSWETQRWQSWETS